tara:strand:- start:56 stop:448 length:393 start_codon:yes stop_codon:yes gene_type:complete
MAYISALEVKEIRKELKKEFPKYKFSVTKDSCGVNVSLMSSPLDLQPEFNITTDVYSPINHYWLDDNWSAPVAKVFKKILKIIKTAPAKAEGGEEWFDESDSMTDYFYTAFYINMQAGKWNKPYTMTEIK